MYAIVYGNNAINLLNSEAKQADSSISSASDAKNVEATFMSPEKSIS